MSELIVRMDMPICCADCPCCICLNGMDPAYCKAVMVDDDNIVDGLMWKKTDVNKRPSWCPIIGELPEQHGDLIDRDILLQTFQNADYETYNDYCEAFDTVEAAETVIAAERKD